MDNLTNELSKQIHEMIDKIHLLINSNTYSPISIQIESNDKTIPNTTYSYEAPTPNYLALTLTNDYKKLSLSNISEKTIRMTLKVLFGTVLLNILKFFL